MTSNRLSGRVERLERAAEPEGDKVEIRVHLAEPGDLRPGELVRVSEIMKDGAPRIISQVYEEG